MTVLSIYGDSTPFEIPHNSFAVYISAALHTAALAIVIGTLPPIHLPQSRPAKHYRVRMLRLRVPARERSPLTYSARTLQPQAVQKNTPQAASTADHGPAAQTLVVPDAPPELKVTTPIPLAISVPSITPARAFKLANAPMPDHAPLIDVNPPPSSNILSLTDDLALNAATVVVPKVNQRAEAAANAISGTEMPQGANGTEVQRAQANSIEPQPATAANQDPQAVAASHEPEIPAKNGEPTENSAEAKLPNVTRKELPPDGKVPVTILGASVSDQYPEITSGLAGKIVSTVYINVGLNISWLLEFWAPGSAPLEAPWAYEMYRPDNLEMPPETQVVLVSGALNTSGRLTDLQLALPPEFPQRDLLLRVLGLWKFRPASRDGAPVGVKVLLVIPRQPEE